MSLLYQKRLRDYSKSLSEVLDTVGASEYVRQRRRHAMITEEIAIAISQNAVRYIEGYTHIFGSAAEGTSTPGLQSDIDMVVGFVDPEVVESLTDTEKTTCFLMIQDKYTPPGYTKLLHVENRDLPANFITRNEDEALDMLGRPMLRNESLTDAITYDEKNGPAGTTLNVEYMPPLDYVPAYRSRSWPSQAIPWLYKNRKYPFLSATVADDFKQYGFFVVPVGQPTSPERHLEWRLSFSIQERIMMSHLNPVQFKCYVVMKMIKHDFIKPVVKGKSLTSYHCKTCLLYTLESTDSVLWTPDALVLCLMKCINTLVQWLRNGFIPNFFIPEENMWKGSRNSRLHAARILKGLLNDTPAFLYRISCDSTGHLLQVSLSGRHHCESDETVSKSGELRHDDSGENSFAEIQRKHDVSLYKWHYWALDYIIGLSKKLIEKTVDVDLDRCIERHRNLLTWLSNISHFRPRMEFTNLDVQTTKEYIFPFIYTSLGSQLAAKSMAADETDSCNHYNEESQKILKTGYMSDALSGRIKHAAILFKQGYYDPAENMLNELHKQIETHVTSWGRCFGNADKVNNALLNRMRDKMLSTREILQESVAACVTYLPTEIDLVPQELQFEMSRSVFATTTRHGHDEIWFDFAVIDAIVYLYFLLYKVYETLGDTRSCEKWMLFLRMAVDHERNLGHPETAKNILGSIFKQQGDRCNAWNCFVDSWMLRPDHNAAKWHMCIMVAEAVAVKLNYTPESNYDDVEILYQRCVNSF